MSLGSVRQLSSWGLPISFSSISANWHPPSTGNVRRKMLWDANVFYGLIGFKDARRIFWLYLMRMRTAWRVFGPRRPILGIFNYTILPELLSRSLSVSVQSVLMESATCISIHTQINRFTLSWSKFALENPVKR